MLGIPVEEKPFSVDELMEADEVIISGTGALCAPVSHIDGIAIGGGAPDILERLRKSVLDEYRQITGA
jgi:D-alanine transaminase